MEKFEALEKTMCKELESIEHKLQGGTEMSETDLKRIDLLAHAMKSLATYTAMKEAEERRYPNAGQGTSYSDGYSMGFRDGMNQRGYPLR